jgi:hypothetical protein
LAGWIHKAFASAHAQSGSNKQESVYERFEHPGVGSSDPRQLCQHQHAAGA